MNTFYCAICAVPKGIVGWELKFKTSF